MQLTSPRLPKDSFFLHLNMTAVIHSHVYNYICTLRFVSSSQTVQNVIRELLCHVAMVTWGHHSPCPQSHHCTTQISCWGWPASVWGQRSPPEHRSCKLLEWGQSRGSWLSRPGWPGRTGRGGREWKDTSKEKKELQIYQLLGIELRTPGSN